jgi:Type II secretion system (T2SS), protein E, N-terminal domain
MEPWQLLSDLGPGEARRQRRSFGAVVVDAGVVTAERLREALAEGARTGERPGEVMVRRGWADERQIGRVLAEQWQLPFMQGVSAVPDSARALLSLEEARRLEAYPISFEDGVAVVAVADPSEERFDAVRARLEHEMRFVIVPRGVLDAVLEGRIPAEVHRADADGFVHELDALTDTLATSSEHLMALQSAIDELADSLRRTREDLAGCRQQLTLAEAERDEHRATIRALEEQLRDRTRRAQELKAKLLDLISTEPGTEL